MSTHVYFSGIGGVGIGPLAQLALDAGYRVSGSDLHESAMTKALQKQGVDVAIGQDGSEIKASNANHHIDWLVYSSALPDDHPELAFARKNNIKTSKRSEFLNTIIKDKDLKLVAVTGTHGKTTTTSMIIWLFKQLGIPVSYSVGTSVSFGPAAQYQKGSEYFIYEADEFDRNFLDFKPELSLIVSMEYDHADTYPTVQDYIEAFQQFAEQSKLCITWEPIAEKLSDKAHLFVVPESQDFTQIKLTGEHNRHNGWLAATAINRLGLIENNLTDWNNMLGKLAGFPTIGRRFEKLADNLYTDYAHHPTEIAATIAMATELSPDIVIIYQPHQNVRQHELLQEGGYKDSFAKAKKIYWLPTYLSREDQKLDILKPETLIATLSDPKQAETAEMNDTLWQKITNHTKNGDLVLAMSAGDLDEWLRGNLEKER